MSRLILMIGLPGSGKSYLAQHLIELNPDYRLVSTDQIRAELYGDPINQGNWLEIWEIAKQQMQEAIKAAPTTIYDATNCKREYRREAINLAKQIGYQYIIGLWLDTPLATCLERNKNRSRQVPEEVIQQMHRQLTDAPSSCEDGFDEIYQCE